MVILLWPTNDNYFKIKTPSIVDEYDKLIDSPDAADI